jgi:hypothetical protein
MPRTRLRRKGFGEKRGRRLFAAPVGESEDAAAGRKAEIRDRLAERYQRF